MSTDHYPDPKVFPGEYDVNIVLRTIESRLETPIETFRKRKNVYDRSEGQMAQAQIIRRRNLVAQIDENWKQTEYFLTVLDLIAGKVKTNEDLMHFKQVFEKIWRFRSDMADFIPYNTKVAGEQISQQIKSVVERAGIVKDPLSTSDNLSLVFNLDDYSPEQISDIIAFLDELYRQEGGDQLEIKSSSIFSNISVTENQLV